MSEQPISQFDPGEVPNNVKYDQALKLGLLPPVTADGQDDYFIDTGTSLTSFQRASKEVSQILSKT